MNAWYVGLGILYLVLIATLAVMTFRKGHWVLGLIGFIFPILWLIGAVLPSRYRRGTPKRHSSAIRLRGSDADALNEAPVAAQVRRRLPRRGPGWQPRCGRR